MKIQTQLRYRVFQVKYFGASNYKGPRVKITDLRNNKSKWLSYDHEFNSSEDIAKNYLESIGISITALDMCADNCFLLSEDFTTELD